jgi:hypothetical protein
MNRVVPHIGASKAIGISDKMRLTALKTLHRFKFYEANSISSLFGRFYPLFRPLFPVGVLSFKVDLPLNVLQSDDNITVSLVIEMMMNATK